MRSFLFLFLAASQQEETTSEPGLSQQPPECNCCRKLDDIAAQECGQFEVLGAMDCSTWRVATEECENQCDYGTYANCTILGDLVYEACFEPLRIVMSDNYAKENCIRVYNDFHRKCSGSCVSITELCKPSPVLSQCMKICGNYKNCECYEVPGTFMSECKGEVIIKDDREQRCEDYLDNVTLHEYCRTGTGPCPDYYVCPTDFCEVARIQCRPDDNCWNAGECQRATGECIYRPKDEDTPCDDGSNITFSDKCLGGLFAGTCEGQSNLCLQYDIQCDPGTPCIIPGECDRITGDCSQQTMVDGTKCNDERIWTEDDKCEKGFCTGSDAKLCDKVWTSKECVPSACVEVSCDPRVGVCERVKINDPPGKCSPGDPLARCVEGECLSVDDREPTYTEVGHGYAVDSKGNRVPGFYGDVANLSQCYWACNEDPVCIGVGFAVSSATCTLYAPMRTYAPRGLTFGGHRMWAWVEGAGESVDGVVTEEENAPIQKVYKKHRTKGDALVTEGDIVGFFVGPGGMLLLLFVIVAGYLALNPDLAIVLWSYSGLKCPTRVTRILNACCGSREAKKNSRRKSNGDDVEEFRDSSDDEGSGPPSDSGEKGMLGRLRKGLRDTAGSKKFAVPDKSMFAIKIDRKTFGMKRGKAETSQPRRPEDDEGDVAEIMDAPGSDEGGGEPRGI